MRGNYKSLEQKTLALGTGYLSIVESVAQKLCVWEFDKCIQGRDTTHLCNKSCVASIHPGAALLYRLSDASDALPFERIRTTPTNTIAWMFCTRGLNVNTTKMSTKKRFTSVTNATPWGEASRSSSGSYFAVEAQGHSRASDPPPVPCGHGRFRAIVLTFRHE